MRLKGDITIQDILKEGESIVINELKGKANVNNALFLEKSHCLNENFHGFIECNMPWDIKSTRLKVGKGQLKKA